MCCINPLYTFLNDWGGWFVITDFFLLFVVLVVVVVVVVALSTISGQNEKIGKVFLGLHQVPWTWLDKGLVVGSTVLVDEE